VPKEVAMFKSFSEFKFFQSFRVPVQKADDVHFSIFLTDKMGKDIYLEDASLVDLSVTGLGMSTLEQLSDGVEVTISMSFKRIQLELYGRIVRSFSNPLADGEIIYGVEIDHEPRMQRLLEQLVFSFTPDRLKECLVSSALRENYVRPQDGYEVFSLLLSLFKDITRFGDQEDFIDNMLSEVTRIMEATRASIFLINPETNELEAQAAMGVSNKDDLKFDYRMGIAGSVFTTGVALNIDTINDRSRFNDAFDKKFGFETKSIICYPIHNREDKTIGVLEVINKKNTQRFSIDDEKTMKVLSLLFSSVFHQYAPISEKSTIRRFSTPFDREHAVVGKSDAVRSLRKAVVRLKDIDSPLLIQGETGVGKTLLARILHAEGQRGLNPFLTVDCRSHDHIDLAGKLWGSSDTESMLTECKNGVLVLKNVEALPHNFQTKLYEVLKERRLDDSKISIDVRIIATSNKDLGAMVAEGDFHRDLFDYLNSSYVTVPPLRRHPDDIDMIVDYFLKVECRNHGLLLKNFSPKAMNLLRRYDWPGNTAELRKCVERAVLYNPKNHIITEEEITDLSSPLLDVDAKARVFGSIPHVDDFSMALKDRLALVEREMIYAEIKRLGNNKSQAAKAMGISREALRKKLMAADAVYDKLQGEAQKKSA
jgi:Nif-specific regulatory protein